MSEFVYARLSRLITRLATAVALLLAAAPAVFYGVLAHVHTAGELGAHLQFQARIVDQFIQQQPDYWEFNSSRLQSLFEPFVHEGEYFRLEGRDGALLFEGGPRPGWAFQSQSVQVHSYGEPVGRLTLGVSQRQSLEVGGWVLLASGLLAWAVWGPARRLPLEALRRAEMRLREHQEHLQEMVESRTAELAEANRRDLAQRSELERMQRCNAQRLELLWDLNAFSADQEESAVMLRGVAALAGLGGADRLWLALYDSDAHSLAAYLWEEGEARALDITATCAHCCVPVDMPLPGDGWAQAAQRVEACMEADGLSGGGTGGQALSVPVYREGRLRLLAQFHRRGTTLEEGLAEQLRLVAEDLWEIVQRRRTEIALEQARRQAEAANLAKSTFLANMGHELRTPLNAMLGHAQLLQRDPSLTPQQRRNAEIVHHSGDHLLTLINDVLDIAKVESGRLELDLTPHPCDLHALLRDMDELFGFRAREKGLAFRYRPAPGLPAQVVADGRRLRQILTHLLGNAVKFTSQGQIGLEAGYLEGWLHLAVTDTGTGISEARLGGLFHPFQQVGDAAYINQGSGLGLAICKGLVDQMGGDIGVESAPGKGSRFSLRLPLVAAQSDDGRGTCPHCLETALPPPVQPATAVLAPEISPSQRESLLGLIRMGNIRAIRVLLDGLPSDSGDTLNQLRMAAARLDLKAMRRLLE